MGFRSKIIVIVLNISMKIFHFSYIFSCWIVGWQGIWKINRATCEQLKINYPTIVFGMVNNVFFHDLKADFSVIAVQDDDVHLPERYEVPLEDLFPTIEQENTELNIDRTADCVDELRYGPFSASFRV